ncbi:zinc finger protein 11-like [Contarinia nasturtii]|uniref:zinc finger protein 11-like n=1 Tax=Contarinia nasturtii TaxID=265458 RepID=UPI0012D4AD1F|nr:zinc finger protein 11-like [Contarinia nasturtii]
MNHVNILEEIFQRHRENIEQHLLGMVNSYTASHDTAPNEIQMRHIFDSLSNRVSNICEIVRESRTSGQAALTNCSAEREPMVKKYGKQESLTDTDHADDKQSKNKPNEIEAHRVDRLSPKMAFKLRSLVDPIVNAKYSPGKIYATCYFCEQNLEASLRQWKRHILQHTGENQFSCSRCHAELSSDKSVHCEAASSVVVLLDGEHLQAFMCRICNYTKTNFRTITRHIYNDHKKSWDEANEFMEKLTLLPDLSRRYSSISTHYKYVEVDRRYNCGVTRCNSTHENVKQLEDHFKTHHTTKIVYFCPHCDEDVNIRNHNYRAINNHLYLHSSQLYECGVCSDKFIGDKKLIKHSVFNHNDEKCTYRRDIRSIVSRAEDLQNVIILFECDKCAARFYVYSKAIQHYLHSHQSLYASLTLIQLFKRVNFDATITWTKAIEWNAYCQQYFVCKWCKDLLKTKEDIIRHCNRCTKFRKELSLKLECDFLTEKPNSNNENSKFDQYLMYFCGICGDSDRSMYGSVDAVYTHWMKCHENKSEPFRFEIDQLVKCRYCNVISTFDAMKKHQDNQHPKKPLVIKHLLDADKCGLCSSNYDRALIQHFENHHQLIFTANLFNPVVLTENILKELVKVKGHKKHKCIHCAEIFETKGEFHKHHDRKHQLLKKQSEKFYDNESVHMICGVCENKTKANHLMNHLKIHNIASKCLLKKFYWETKVVFGNGLILNKHNLLGTEWDDSKLLGV